MSNMLLREYFFGNVSDSGLFFDVLLGWFIGMEYMICFHFLWSIIRITLWSL